MVEEVEYAILHLKQTVLAAQTMCLQNMISFVVPFSRNSSVKYITIFAA